MTRMPLPQLSTRRLDDICTQAPTARSTARYPSSTLPGRRAPTVSCIWRRRRRSRWSSSRAPYRVYSTRKSGRGCARGWRCARTRRHRRPLMTWPIGTRSCRVCRCAPHGRWMDCECSSDDLRIVCSPLFAPFVSPAIERSHQPSHTCRAQLGSFSLMVGYVPVVIDLYSEVRDAVVQFS